VLPLSDDFVCLSTSQSENKPPLNNENVLLNELILEYLMYNGYSVAASVLITESGHPKGLLGRKFLQNELKIVPTRGSDLPILYFLLKNTLRSKDTDSSES
jgi:lisH domain-containing protein FOPNL